MSLFFDNLSQFFPPGERFFVASVKAHRSRITDPRLLEEVDGFCAQEGHHSREHVRYNAMVRQHGYAAASLEPFVEKLLRVVSRLSPRRRQLAVTCALEHFTALLGSLVLKYPQLLDDADPQMAELWRWHAWEETEHRAVAYDVYRAVRGPWLERVFVMFTTTIVFWSLVAVQQLRLMRADGILFSVREWWSLARWLFGTPWNLQQLLVPYLRYYAPSFHPGR